MSSATFTWNGDQVEDEVHKRLAENLQSFARDVVQRAEQFAPKRTGRLATSIGYDWNYQTLSVVFTVDAPYGIFVEYGTRYMAPHPYLRPALNAVGPVYGFHMEMVFANTPEYANPVLAHNERFFAPPTLTDKQRARISENKAYSRKYYHATGNVRHVRMHPRRRHF